ncbi:restriction endonuclease [Streptomyces californicus]|uniref:nSTAND3 domain-containing NTPase n=1 Tax=Streptomyces californicus TaxID=67351 RepID=UPI0034D985A5
METFDLARLTDFDFEAVCKDIFEKEFGVSLEIFSTGKDGGVDLRHYRASGQEMIVQCKHWVRSSESKLVSYMRKTELPKIRKLQPGRYVLATSMSLTKGTKDKLFEALKPHVKSSGDIFGQEELNALLRKHDDVVRRHLRLWLTSASVLQSLLSKSVLTRSHALAHEVNNTLKVYAANESYSRAIDLLEQVHVSVIAGIPGIGKTTLAHVICANYLSAGYELIEISEDVEEANGVWDDAVPQIFYYDDFLGQTALEEKLGKNEDGRLLSLMKRVSASPNKRFVLTTREYILAQARQRYERLDRHSFDVQTCVIDVADYTYRTRAVILYNHLYNSNLPRDIRSRFADRSAYQPIIAHRNFNPRIIAATLAEAVLLSDDNSSIAAEVLRNLEEPSRIWGHIVENQLSHYELVLVKLTFSLLGDVRVEELQDIWVSNGFQVRDFRRAIATLDGTMLKTSRLGGYVFSGFHNPSVRDYMKTYFQERPEEVLDLINSAQKFEQISGLWVGLSVADSENMSALFGRWKKDVELAVSKLFPVAGLRTHSHSSPQGDPVYRAAVCLEMGIDIDSTHIRELGLAEVKENDPVANATDQDVIIQLIRQLKRIDSDDMEGVVQETAASAIEWSLGDISTWDLMEWADGYIDHLEREVPGLDTYSARETLNDARDDYAQSAADDWLSGDGSDSSVDEMRDIVSHYQNVGYFEHPNIDLDALNEKIEAQDAEHSVPEVARPLDHLNDPSGRPERSEMEIVQSMMESLRSDEDR